MLAFFETIEKYIIAFSKKNVLYILLLGLHP